MFLSVSSSIFPKHNNYSSFFYYCDQFWLFLGSPHVVVDLFWLSVPHSFWSVEVVTL